MDEEIEALWIDRDLHLIHGSLFDDLMWASSEASDIGWNSPPCPAHPDGAVSRVVVLNPSERLLRTASAYGNVGTRLQKGPSGCRLVLGPAIGDDEVGFAASVDANDLYATIIRSVVGEEEGGIELAVLTQGEAAAGTSAWAGEA